MKNHLNSWREKFVHALFRHTCTLIACRNGEVPCKTLIACSVKVIGKNDFTLTKTVTILFVHERGNSVHASRGYGARRVPEFPCSWTNNIVTITSSLLSKEFKVYSWSHLLKILNTPVRPQKEKKSFCKSDNRKWTLAIPNLKMSTCSIWESFQRTVLQGKNGSPGKNGYRKHGWVVIRTDEGAGCTVGAGGKMSLVAAHEKHVSEGFDRSG